MTPLAENLKKYRKQKKMSQMALARLIKKNFNTDIAQNTISQYEQGVREPNLATLKIIAEALGVTINDLIGPIDSSFSYEDFDELAQDPDYNPMDLNFDDEFMKSMKGLSDAGEKFMKESSVGYFHEYLFKEFGEEYSELLNEFTAKEKQEIYEKAKDYIELLLKAKEKKS